MSKNLKHLFDFQKFEGNSRLSSMIAETESRYGVGMSHNLELSDDELTLTCQRSRQYGSHEGRQGLLELKYRKIKKQRF